MSCDDNCQVSCRLTLFVGAGDGSLTLLDARSGMVLSASKDAWLRPKHGDTALGMFLLNACGLPACVPPGKCVLSWAHNTRDVHGMFFDGSLRGGSPGGASTGGSPSPSLGTREGPVSIAQEATSIPASEASSVGTHQLGAESHPEMPLQDECAAEQPGREWHALAAQLNSSESQCSIGDGQHALRTSLAAPGSPPAWDQALLGRGPAAQHRAPTKQGISGLGSPECYHESAGELAAQLGCIARMHVCLSAKLC